MTAVDPRVRVSLIESFGVEVDGHHLPLPRNAERLLAYLALRGGVHQRSHVSATLWLDSPEERAAANLRTVLWKLADSKDRLVALTGNHLALAPGVEVDYSHLLQRARRLIDQRVEPDLDDDDTDVGSLSGDLLPDWDEDWILFERERLRQLRVHALESLCARLTRLGRFGEAVDAGLSAVSAEPLRESAQRVLIAAHLAEGNISEARRQFGMYRGVLADHLGIEPTPELAAAVGLR